MKRLLFAILLIIASASPAAAFDPDASPSEPEPEPEVPEVGPEPRPEAPEVIVSEPEPAGPSETPEGIYYVTDTYVRDVVTRSGNTTTYATETVRESTGSYARVVGYVGTGERSVFDGTAFNGRSTFPNGTPVAGTYYENFVLTPDGYVAVSIVFFQDDSVTNVSPGSTPARPVSTGPAAAPPAVLPVPSDAGAPEDRDRDRVREVTTRAADLTVGIALASDGPILLGAEVLRGREVRFWPRVFDAGAAIPITSWRLIGPLPDLTLATSGGSDPFVAEWRQMPSNPWTLVFEIGAGADQSRTLTATIVVAVRSPALVQ